MAGQPLGIAGAGLPAPALPKKPSIRPSLGEGDTDRTTGFDKAWVTPFSLSNGNLWPVPWTGSSSRKRTPSCGAALFHFRHGPEQPLPGDVVTDNQIIAQLMGNKIAEGLIRHLASHPARRGARSTNLAAASSRKSPKKRGPRSCSGLAEQLAEGGQIALVADDAEDVVGLQPGTARRCSSSWPRNRAQMRVPWACAAPARGADAPLLGAQAIDEGLPLAVEIDLQARAVDGEGGAGTSTRARGGGERQRAALQDEGDQHHEEGDVEVELGARQSRHHGEDREDDGHGAAQSHPGDKPALAGAKF